ncbi:hypothetical protein [Microcoleus sp. bin38.metabat.b11b12b14.051]|uniref:hypothetical protein n=1 Tax=Microcoleus sp. bin38.metabat.b11b12b14.051 TaxID=2742709 RepID=UPI0025FC8FA8|nr:hypothetical protein [Microcoleus sp. bin38.metabat.b11b12b14.051]
MFLRTAIYDRAGAGPASALSFGWQLFHLFDAAAVMEALGLATGASATCLD